MMLRRDDGEMARLRAEALAAKIERENARQALRDSLRRLAQYLEEIPLDEGLDDMGRAVSGRERR